MLYRDEHHNHSHTKATLTRSLFSCSYLVLSNKFLVSSACCLLLLLDLDITGLVWTGFGLRGRILLGEDFARKMHVVMLQELVDLVCHLLQSEEKRNIVCVRVTVVTDLKGPWVGASMYSARVIMYCS